MIVLIVVGTVVVILGGLAALSVVAYRKVQNLAQEVQKQKWPALKPPGPLTAEQKKALEQFGNELAAALTARDSAKVKSLQDAEALATRVFESLPPGTPNVAEMRSGFIGGTQRRDGGWMWSAMSGEATFLRLRERHGFPAVLLRIKSEEGAVNYLDVIVRPEGAGFRAVDMFNYIFATMVSEEARNVMAAMISKPGNGLAAILGIPNMDEEMLKHVNSINEATRTGNMTEVLRICNDLPPERKTQRLFFIMRLQALMALNANDDKLDSDYRAALRAAPEILGKDSTTDLLMVDLLFLEEDFKGAEKCLERVDAVVGGDPYLKFLQASTRLQMKDYQGALDLATVAQKEDPRMAELVDLRLTVHLARKDFKALVNELRDFKRNFGQVLDRKALEGDAAYAEFLTTPEFAAWEKENSAP